MRDAEADPHHGTREMQPALGSTQNKKLPAKRRAEASYAERR